MKLTQFQLTKVILSLGADKLDISSYSFLVLIYLSNMVRSDNNYSCYPSHETLCKKLGINDTRTLKKYLKELETKSLIIISYGGGSSTNTYYVNVDRISQLGEDIIDKIFKPKYDVTTKPIVKPKPRFVQEIDDDPDWVEPY